MQTRSADGRVKTHVFFIYGRIHEQVTISPRPFRGWGTGGDRRIHPAWWHALRGAGAANLRGSSEDYISKRGQVDEPPLTDDRGNSVQEPALFRVGEWARVDVEPVQLEPIRWSRPLWEESFCHLFVDLDRRLNTQTGRVSQERIEGRSLDGQASMEAGPGRGMSNAGPPVRWAAGPRSRCGTARRARRNRRCAPPRRAPPITRVDRGPPYRPDAVSNRNLAT